MLGVTPGSAGCGLEHRKRRGGRQTEGGFLQKKGRPRGANSLWRSPHAGKRISIHGKIRRKVGTTTGKVNYLNTKRGVEIKKKGTLERRVAPVLEKKSKWGIKLKRCFKKF